MSARHLARLLVAFVLLGVLVSFTRRVGAVERNFAGSGQFDYHYVVNGKSPGGTTPRDGFTTELALKVAVDVTDKVSANVKVCYGCHGFEVPMAHLDYRVADELNFRVGRFSPSLGAFNLRHDPANHRLSSKPLIYDMGRMLRKNEWNMGVLPSPFPDNGVEVSGTHWFGESVQLDYALYAVSGFKAASDATDLDFQLNRQPYYTDNNSRPTVGGRLALTFKLGEARRPDRRRVEPVRHVRPRPQAVLLVLRRRRLAPPLAHQHPRRVARATADVRRERPHALRLRGPEGRRRLLRQAGRLRRDRAPARQEGRRRVPLRRDVPHGQRARRERAPEAERGAALHGRRHGHRRPRVPREGLHGDLAVLGPGAG
ncbi:MAG: hypothetical protein IPJ34_33040 [Myxococcales bacterium]|nr:hypothetical protein [Myxococcales bacterium]